MAKSKKLNKSEKSLVEKCVAHFESNRGLYEAFAGSLLAQIQSNASLMCHIHSVKSRIKDPDHLRDKLERKILEAKNGESEFDVSTDTLFSVVNDLAGVRLLHLHTTQLKAIHAELTAMFHEQKYRLVEEPTANCWDREFEQLFQSYGIATKSRDSMYTTIHYVLEANQRSRLTCEIQVRTLFDEVWGEVSHMVNYPHETQNAVCKDQLKVLARLTSGGVRLVDSIFNTIAEEQV